MTAARPRKQTDPSAVWLGAAGASNQANTTPISRSKCHNRSSKKTGRPSGWLLSGRYSSRTGTKRGGLWPLGRSGENDLAATRTFAPIKRASRRSMSQAGLVMRSLSIAVVMDDCRSGVAWKVSRRACAWQQRENIWHSQERAVTATGSAGFFAEGKGTIFVGGVCLANSSREGIFTSARLA